MNFPVPLYSRMIRVMADRGFQDDPIFWQEYAFKYIFYDPRTKSDKLFSHDEAKTLWDTFVLLKLKCPLIDVKEVLSYLEAFMLQTSMPQIEPQQEQLI
jgi:hypothetical protein